MHADATTNRSDGRHKVIGVIFDMDGVLVDSFDAHLESWRQIAADHGVTITQPQFAASFGMVSREIIRRFWGDSGFPPDSIVKAIDDSKESLYRNMIARDFPAMPGCREFIDALTHAGIPMAVGSSGPPENICAVLQGLGRPDAFSTIVSGSDVRRGKPDPQVFQLAAQRLDLPPQQCVVIDDAPVGVTAGRKAGCCTIAFLSKGRSREQFADDSPDLFADSFAELSVARIRSLVAGTDPRKSDRK